MSGDLLDVGWYYAHPSSNNSNIPFGCCLTHTCSCSRSLELRLSSSFLPFFVVPVMSQRCLCLVPGCTLWLLPGTLPSENTLFFGCVRNSGFLAFCRPFSGRNSRSSLVHTYLCCILPCVGRRDRARSRRVVDRYIYLRALVDSGCPSRIALLPIPDRGAVLCAAPVLLAG